MRASIGWLGEERAPRLGRRTAVLSGSGGFCEPGSPAPLRAACALVHASAATIGGSPLQYTHFSLLRLFAIPQLPKLHIHRTDTTPRMNRRASAETAHTQRRRDEFSTSKTSNRKTRHRRLVSIDEEEYISRASIMAPAQSPTAVDAPPPVEGRRSRRKSARAAAAYLSAKLKEEDPEDEESETSEDEEEEDERQTSGRRPLRRTVSRGASARKVKEEEEEEEYVPAPSPPPSPRPYIRASRGSRSAGHDHKKAALSPRAVEYLKAWMMSPAHIEHPYPTEDEKVRIMRATGIELKQLTNWFVNNRKRYWKPRVEEMRRRGAEKDKTLPGDRGRRSEEERGDAQARRRVERGRERGGGREKVVQQGQRSQEEEVLDAPRRSQVQGPGRHGPPGQEGAGRGQAADASGRPGHPHRVEPRGHEAAAEDEPRPVHQEEGCQGLHRR